eukprot:1159411-Pelagomonas_calceolata.AAC.16
MQVDAFQVCETQNVGKMWAASPSIKGRSSPSSINDSCATSHAHQKLCNSDATVAHIASAETLLQHQHHSMYVTIAPSCLPSS